MDRGKNWFIFLYFPLLDFILYLYESSSSKGFDAKLRKM